LGWARLSGRNSNAITGTSAAVSVFTAPVENLFSDYSTVFGKIPDGEAVSGRQYFL
jgi:hypothetical protein